MKTTLSSNAKSVLLVDDDTELTDLLTYALSSSGIQVTTAANGNEALAQIAQGSRPRLILTDISMPTNEGSPRMSGLELVSQLRENAQTENIPVIVASGHENLRAMAQKLGVQGYLKKPYGLGAVEAVIRSYLKCEADS